MMPPHEEGTMSERGLSREIEIFEAGNHRGKVYTPADLAAPTFFDLAAPSAFAAS